MNTWTHLIFQLHSQNYLEVLIYCIVLYCIVLYCIYFCLFRALPTAYGGSQARGLIGAIATGLHHSHRTPDLSRVCTYTTAHSSARSLIHWARPGIEPAISWLLVVFVSLAPRWEHLEILIYKEDGAGVVWYSLFLITGGHHDPWIYWGGSTRAGGVNSWTTTLRCDPWQGP